MQQLLLYSEIILVRGYPVMITSWKNIRLYFAVAVFLMELD